MSILRRVKPQGNLKPSHAILSYVALTDGALEARLACLAGRTGNGIKADSPIFALSASSHGLCHSISLRAGRHEFSQGLAMGIHLEVAGGANMASRR
jgi:hypothetical protein